MEWGNWNKPWPVAVSDLDGYAWYAGPGIENGMTSEEFLRRLNREEPENVAMRIGTEFHTLVENAQNAHVGFDAAPKSNNSKRVEFSFDGDFEVPAADIVEMEIVQKLKTAHGWAELRGVVDGLAGTHAYEIKTTKSIKFERYQDSWQWRAYLHMTGLDQFHYHVFRVQYGRGEEDKFKMGGNPRVRVAEHEQMRFYRYPSMENDLRTQCGELVAFMRAVSWQPPKKRPMMAI